MDQASREKLKEMLDRIPSKVTLVYFTKEDGCPTCNQQLQILREIASVSAKVELTVRDFVTNGDDALAMRIERVPATVVVGTRDFGIRYYGIAAGYEFTSLLEAIVMASTGESGLEPELEEAVKRLPKPLNLKIFVTPLCPHCQKMVKIAYQFAIADQGMQVEVIEGAEFPALADKYGVSGVPKTVIDDGQSFEGAPPAWSVYLQMLKAVDPERYALLEEDVRQAEEGEDGGPQPLPHLRADDNRRWARSYERGDICLTEGARHGAHHEEAGRPD